MTPTSHLTASLPSGFSTVQIFRGAFSCLAIAFGLLTGLQMTAQATGEMAIIGFNSDTTSDEMTLVTLAPISSGQTYYISDYFWESNINQFNNAGVVVGREGFNNPTDGILTWTTTSAIAAGTVIRLAITPGSPATVSGLPGTVTTTGWRDGVTALGGDNWFIYQGTDKYTPTNWIFGWANWSTPNSPAFTWTTPGTAVTGTTSTRPLALTNGVNAIALTGTTITTPTPQDPHFDNMVYTGTRTGTQAALLAAICTPANWTGHDANVIDISAGGTSFPGANPIFTIGSPTPTITSVSTPVGNAGTALTLTGTNFTGATAVTIGGVAVTSFTVVNASTVSVVVPAGAVGSAAIVVTTAGGTATGTGLFSYVDYTVNTVAQSGSVQMTVTNISNTSDTLTVSGTGSNVTFAAAGRAFSLNGTAAVTGSLTTGIPTTADSSSRITLNTQGGDDVIDLSTVAGALPAIIIDGGLGTDTVNVTGTLAQSSAYTYGALLAAETVNFGQSSSWSVPGSITLTADTVEIDPTATISLIANLNVRTQTALREIVLGLEIVGTLSLTDAELDRVTAGGLTINGEKVRVKSDITRAVATVIVLSPSELIFDGGALNSGGSPLAVLGTTIRCPFPASAISGGSPFTMGSDIAAQASTLSLAISAATYPQYERLDTQVAPTLSGCSLTLAKVGSYTPVAGDAFTVINNLSASPVVGTFSGLAQGGTIANFLGSGLDAQITYTGGDGNDVVLTVLAPQPDIAVFNGASTAPGDARTDGVGSFSFGGATPGSSVVRTFTVQNTGAGTLSGLTLTKTGDVPGHYTLGTPGGATLAPNASTTFTVTFTPQAGGTAPLTAGLQIGSDDPDENPFDIALTGTAPSAGEVDLGLDPGVMINQFTMGNTIQTFPASFQAVSAQPDGKALLGGEVSSIAGTPRRSMARLTVTGPVDSFDPSPNRFVNCQAVQADGRVLLAGGFSQLKSNGAPSPTTRNKLARVNADGTLDLAFNPNVTGVVSSILPLANGQILIGGQFTKVGTTTVSKIARLNSNGSLDTSFTSPVLTLSDVRALAVDAGGRIWVGGYKGTTGSCLYRLLANGTLDSTFTATGDGFLVALTVQADGKILVGGKFANIGGAARANLARLEATGVLDTTFNPPAPNDSVMAMSLQADGRIIVGGDFTKVGTVDRNRLARLNANGTLDTAFNPNANNSVRSTALQGDGKVLVGGEYTTIGGVTRSGFARLYNDAATQTLATAGPTLVNWTRGGAVSEISSATLEHSTDSGVTWTQVGAGTRVGTTANWTFTGLSLPANGQLRARGRTVDKNSSIVETILPSYAVIAPEIAITTTPGSTNVAAGGLVDFGSLTTGTVDRVFTVTNTGDDVLTLGTPAISGAQAGSYAVLGVIPTSVAIGGTATFTLRFSPSAADTNSAVISIPTNDGDENPYVFGLLGTLDQPEIAVTDAANAAVPSVTGSATFGETSVNTSRELSFTISNSGTQNLLLNGSSAVQITGANASQFQVLSQPSTTVLPVGSVAFSVRFTPTSAGAKTASLSIANNDATPDGANSEAPYTFSLSGSATTAAVPVTFSQAIGGWKNTGTTFQIGTEGTTDNTNNWPAAEAPAKAIDGNTTTNKYLNFKGSNVGLILNVATGSAPATRLSLWTANDVSDRDPTRYEIYGSTLALAGTALATIPLNASTMTLISSGTITTPTERNTGPTDVYFANTTAYAAYVVIFPTVRTPADGRTQFSEVALSQKAQGTPEMDVQVAKVTATVSVDSVLGGAQASGQFEIGQVGGTIATNQWPANESPAGAVDNDLSTKFLSFRGIDTCLLVRVPAGSPAVNSLVFHSPTNSSAERHRDPIRVRVYGSTTDYSASTAAGTKTNFPTQLTNEDLRLDLPNTGYRTVTFTNDTACRYYVIRFTDLRGVDKGLFQIGDMQLQRIEQQAPGASVDFGALTHNASAPDDAFSMDFTVRNTGSGNLSLTSAISGLNASDFTISPQPVNPVNGSAGSTTFTVTFNPSSIGVKTAQLTLLSDDADEGTTTVTLTGTSIQSVPMNTATALGGWTNGATTLTIGSQGTTFNSNQWPSTQAPPVAVDGTVSSVFLLFKDGNVGLVVTPQSGSGSIAVNRLVFYTGADQPGRDPASYSLYGSTVAITSGSSIPLTGGTMTQIVSNAPITLPAARSSASPEVTFVNNTAYASYILVFETTKADQNGFEANITQIGEVQFSRKLQPSPEIAVELQTSGDPRDLVNNDSVNKVDFGTLATDSSVVYTFTVQNTGLANLTGLTTSISGTGSPSYSVSSITAPVGFPTGSTTFTVTYTPSATNPTTPTSGSPRTDDIVLSIANNDENESPFRIQITGKAVPPADFNITTTPTSIIIVDNTGHPGTLNLSEVAGQLRFASASKSFRINGSSTVTIGQPSTDFDLTGITQITVDTGTQNDTITVGAFTAALPSLSLSGGTGNDVVKFDGNITFAANANLDVDLQNDNASPGLDSIYVLGRLLLSGTGAATLKCSRDMGLGTTAAVEVVNGNLTLEANQQAVAATGNFYGITVRGALRSSGTGNILVSGKSGGGFGGIYVVGYASVAEVASTGTGTITLTGTAPASAMGNHGVSLYDGAVIRSVAGDISLTGTAGAGSGEKIGIQIRSASVQASGPAKITMTATAGDSTDNTSTGVSVVGTLQTAAGDLTITATSGTGTESNAFASYSPMTSGTGSISITGNAGNGSSFSRGASLNANVSTAGGNLTINGTSTGAGTTSIGVHANTGFTTTGGLISLNGTAGSAGSISLGIYHSTVTTQNGNIIMDGQGGNAGNSTGISAVGKATSTGSGSIQMIGRSGEASATGESNGLVVSYGGGVTTTTGSVTLSGTSNAALTTALATHGIKISGAIRSTTGNLAITGVAGGSTVSANGVFITNLLLTGGTVSVTGTGFGSTSRLGIATQGAIQGSAGVTLISDSIDIGYYLISPAGVSLRQKTNTKPIVLGGTDSAAQLGLTDAELDFINAPIVTIGDANSGAVSVSAVISPALYKTLSLAKPVTIASGGGFSSDITSATIFEKMLVNGQATLQSGTLFSAAILGGYLPSVPFPIIDGTAAPSGTFTGLPEGSLITVPGLAPQLSLTYAGGSDGFDVTLQPGAALAVVGNATLIASGGTTPSSTDHTDFGNVSPAGTNSIKRTFTIRNDGLAAITLSAPVISGTHGSDFTVTGTPPATSLAYNESTEMEVTFDPSALGLRTATITLTPDDNNAATNPDAPFVFDIQGTGANATPTDIVLTNNLITENNAIGDTVGTLSTVDADTADTHTYSLVSGTGDDDNASFEIVGTALKIKVVADYETQTSYKVRINTNDGTADFAKEFTIVISDEYEILPTIVTNTLDTGVGSLRQAVLNANANTGANAITFDPAVFATAQTIALSSGLQLTGQITITAPAAGVTVQGPNNSEPFAVAAGATANFTGLTISSSGLCLSNEGTLTAGNCVFTGNGNGIRNDHIATVSGCEFSVSTSVGIENSSTGTLVVNDSTFRSVYSLSNEGIATMTGCTVICGVGEAALTNSRGGSLTLVNCTAVVESGTYLFQNNDSGTTVTAIHCTFIEPTGSYTDSGATLTLKNTIYLRNSGSSPFTDGGGNLVLNSTGTDAPSLAADLTALGLDPTGLQDNGGPTLTLKLLSGPALNGGVDASVPGGLTTDQRGSGFPRSVGTVDIGAYEHPNPVDLVATTVSAAEGSGAGTTAFTFTVTRPGATTDAVTLDYAVTGTGTNPADAADFGGTLPGGSITLAIGEASKTIPIAVSEDGIIESDETFTLTVSNPTAAHAIAGTGAVATIANDDFNANPTFSGYTYSTKKNTPASVAGAKILARAADSDGGTLALTAVSPASAQGGSVSLVGSNVRYTPASNYTGQDTFTVTISDGQGGSVIGTITVDVTAGSGTSQNRAQLTVLPGGNVALLFMGIPAQSYVIQRSTDMTTWATVATVAAAADGTIPYTDTNPPPGGTAFYRTAVTTP